jgi:hypothetical protein
MIYTLDGLPSMLILLNLHEILFPVLAKALNLVKQITLLIVKIKIQELMNDDEDLIFPLESVLKKG